MSEPENPLIPHSLDFVGTPWATRPTEFRSAGDGSYVPPELRGDLAGTPAYDAGALPRPLPYDWSGGGPVPNELYAMAADLATAFGGAMGPLPAQSDATAFADWLSRMYQGITTKGEGCGIEPDAVDRAIIENAQLGPHHVAYALQELVRTSPLCRELLIRRPLEKPPTVPREPPSRGPLDRATPKEPTSTAKKKGNALKWTLAGIGILAVVGGSIWYMTRAAKKRRNPCSCANPLVAVGYEEERENPYSGTAGYSSIDPGVLDHAALVSPVLGNPSRKRRKARR